VLESTEVIIFISYHLKSKSIKKYNRLSLSLSSQQRWSKGV